MISLKEKLQIITVITIITHLGGDQDQLRLCRTFTDIGGKTMMSPKLTPFQVNKNSSLSARPLVKSR